jgi:hypothetical protein
MEHAPHTCEPGGESEGCPIVAARGDRDGFESSSQRVTYLRESNAVLLRTGRVSAFKLQEELPDAVLALQVASASEAGVADLGGDQIFVSFETLVERSCRISGDPPAALEVLRYGFEGTYRTIE